MLTKLERAIETYEGQIRFTSNQSRGNCWRLVHDGENVRAVVEGSSKDITSSMSIIEEFGTKQDVLKRINTLELHYDDPDSYKAEILISK